MGSNPMTATSTSKHVKNACLQYIDPVGTMPRHATFWLEIKWEPVSRVEGVSQTITKPPQNASQTRKKICHFPEKNGPPKFCHRDLLDRVLTKLHWGGPSPFSKVCHAPPKKCPHSFPKTMQIPPRKPHTFLPQDWWPPTSVEGVRRYGNLLSNHFEK